MHTDKGRILIEEIKSEAAVPDDRMFPVAGDLQRTVTNILKLKRSFLCSMGNDVKLALLANSDGDVALSAFHSIKCFFRIIDRPVVEIQGMIGGTVFFTQFFECQLTEINHDRCNI